MDCQSTANASATTTDYRDEFDALIRERFKSRKDFCLATGLPEEDLNLFLAKQADFDIATLVDGLARIGWSIHIVPKGRQAALREDFDRYLAAVPDVPPSEDDRIE